MNKYIAIVVLAAVILGVGVIVLQSRSSQPQSQTPSATPTSQAVMEEASPSAAQGNTVEITVEGSPFKFIPNEIKAKKGDTVKVTFKNTGGFHNFMLSDFTVATKELQAGQEETVEFVADKTGTFEFYCSVGDHKAKGMVGTLVVE